MLTIAVLLFVLKECNCYLVLPHKNVSSGTSGAGWRLKGYPSHTHVPSSQLKYFDYRDYNMVSPVKNQGRCDASWAFSIVANIESQSRLYLVDENVILSEQFLIDCDLANNGCTFEPVKQTFSDIVTRLGGIMRQNDYCPYVERRMKCRWNPTNTDISKHGGNSSDWSYPPPGVLPVLGYSNIPPDENIIAETLVRFGTMTAAINSASMMKYTGGIDEPTDENCDPTYFDHAVLIVGFNTYVSDSGEETPYWVIKNSWGTGWGDNGYYYLVRGRNACGIATHVAMGHIV